MIKASELHDVLIKAKINISDKEIDEVISQVDYHENKMINYSEFLAATIDVKNFLTNSRLKAIFN